MTEQLPAFYNLPRGQRLMMLHLVETIRTKGESPTIQELADNFEMFPQNVHSMLKKLEKKGLITREKNAHRGITLPEAKS